MSSFEPVIGLEIHCQLATDSKIFCSCPARPPKGVSVSSIPPNTYVCPICCAHPGTLPVLNQKVVEYAVRAGLATNCTIREQSVFARKNYFYPDLPKGYQISQYEEPICENGRVEIEDAAGNKKSIRMIRIHMEEDAGKSVHQGSETLVNLNRAGVPLIEIVSAPELSSPAEAGALMRALYAIMTSIGVCDGNLQEGNFRCDANVSVRPVGSKTLGTRTEIKNVNSFRFVEKAIEGEIKRQIKVIEDGGKITQETRLYDPDRDVTEVMRTKEDAHDYRYFPDPDLPLVIVTQEQLRAIKADLPELPAQKRARWMGDYGLSSYDVAVLLASKELTQLFEGGIELLNDGQKFAKPLTNFITGELSKMINESPEGLSGSKFKIQHLVDVTQEQIGGKISASAAKKILGIVWSSGESVQSVIQREGLAQVSDLSALEPIVDRIILENPAQWQELCGGKEKLMGYFVGKLMKETQGKGNPALLQDLIKRRMGS